MPSARPARDRSPVGMADPDRADQCRLPLPRHRWRAPRRQSSSCARVRWWRWSAPTARARARWRSCSAGCSPRRAGEVAGTASTWPAATRGVRTIAPVFQDYAHYVHTARRGDRPSATSTGSTTRAHQGGRRMAGADELIEPLPDGFDTRLSTSFTGGTELSIGQWQRMAIARAFFRDAPFVRDRRARGVTRPTGRARPLRPAALAGQDRMVVFISHRFATVRGADHDPGARSTARWPRPALTTS